MTSSKNGPIIVVFGITGDLSRRKLLPALYHLLSQSILPPDTKIVGVSRRPLAAKELLTTVELCVLEVDKVCDPAGLQLIENGLETLQLHPEKPEDFARLKQLLHHLDPEEQREKLFYMSIPADAYAPIVKQLGTHGLNDARSRLLLEKPFGHDYASAEELIGLIGEHFDESQVYRIDHYLAKETAQNLLAFRLHNPIFVPLWTAEHIQRVHIRAFETIGIEGRGNFYEQTGALRDLIQSHLLQLLAITLMDIPKDMSAQAIHLSKEHFLEQLQAAEPNEAVRGQYEGYRHEAGSPESHVETYARLQLRHTAERWQSTEMILETGKALAEKLTTVTVEFKTAHERQRNNLVFRIQPNEGIGLGLIVKGPGFEDHMHHAVLDLRYQDVFDGTPQVDAYERVLMDALRADQALFASDREVLATWRVLQPVLDKWKHSGTNLRSYPIGSQGPKIHPQ